MVTKDIEHYDLRKRKFASVVLTSRLNEILLNSMTCVLCLRLRVQWISLKWNIVHVSWVTYKSVSLQGREPRMIRELVKRSGKRKWNVMLLVRFPTQIYHVRNYLCLLLRNILLFPWGSYIWSCVLERGDGASPTFQFVTSNSLSQFLVKCFYSFKKKYTF